MSWSKVLVIALGGALVAGPAFAQDDDDLMQLSPTKKKEPRPKPRPKARPKAPPKQPVTSSDDELTPLTPSKGELVLKVAGAAPKRAKVTIDDREVGTLPISSQSLSVGEHTIAIRAPGHATWTKKITISANRPTEVPVILDANAALVSVSSDTVGAQVLINGKLVGTAPIEELEIAPGATTITVRKEGYKESTQTLKLIAGKDYPLSVRLGAPITTTTTIVANTDRPENPNLVPSPNEDLGIGTRVEESAPLYTRWYFWAGAAAVVAAVAVGSAVAVSSNQQRALGEPAICGPAGCDSCIGFMCTIMPASGFVPLKF